MSGVRPKLRMDIAGRVAALCLFLAMAGNALAQDTPAAPAARGASSAQDAQNLQLNSILSAKQIALEGQLEDRVRKLVPGESGQYLLVVKVSLDKARIAREFLPPAKPVETSPRMRSRVLPFASSETSDTPQTLSRDLTTDVLFGFISRINVSLTLDTSLGADQVAGIKQAIEQALQITPGRGAVTVKQAGMSSAGMRRALDEEKGRSEIEKAKLQAEIRSMTDEMRKLRIESSTANSNRSPPVDDAKLSRLLAEIDTLKGVVGSIDSRTGRTPAEVKKEFAGPLAPVKRVLEGLEIPAALVVMALAGLLVVSIIGFVYTRVQSRTANNLAAGLSALAGAVNKIATNQAQAQGGFGRDVIDAQAAQAAQLGAGGAAGNAQPLLGGGEGGNGTSQSLELAAKEAMGTLDLLRRVPYPMLSALKDWLTEPEGMLRFLAFSEAIGAENARALWSKFPREEIDSLGPYMYRPVSKAQAYATVLQLYRYVTKEMGTKPLWFAGLDLEFLVSLGDHELAELIDSMEMETAACGMLFVSSGRAGRLLKLLRETQPEDLVGTMKDMATVSEADARRHAETLKREKPQARSTNEFDISDTLVHMLEGVDAQARDAALRILEEDPELGTRIKARVFTFDDALKVDDDTLTELLSVFETEQLATLLLGLPQAQSQRIANLFGEKVRFGLGEEIQRLNAKPSLQRKARVASATLQSALARRVKALVDSGQVALGEGKREAS